jgi:hypothetical protein
MRRNIQVRNFGPICDRHLTAVDAVAPGLFAEPRDVTEIEAFNASLLNGGQKRVRAIFKREALQARTGTRPPQPPQTQKEGTCATRGVSRRAQGSGLCSGRIPLASQRGKRGLLFHSDFREHKEDNILRWQTYEFDKTFSPSKPPDYPYHDSTTLFSGFRWVLQEFLELTDTHHTAIFASTYFSVWAPILDELKQFRDKPAIKRVILSYRLSLQDIKTVLKEMGYYPKRTDPAMDTILKRWCNRPGYFFDKFLHELRCVSTSSSPNLLSTLRQIDNQARKHAEESLKRDFAELAGTNTVQVAEDQIEITGKELRHFLIYCYRIHGGNVRCSSEFLSSLVAAGIGLVESYEFKSKCVGLVCEPLVAEFLSSLEGEASVCCDKYIAKRISEAVSTGYGNEVEAALANQVLRRHGQALGSLLKEWLGPDDKPLSTDYTDFLLRPSTAAEVDDLQISDASDFLFNMQGLERIILPRGNVVMPDLSFFATSSDGTRNCLITMQSKVMKTKMGGKAFNDAVRNTST